MTPTDHDEDERNIAAAFNSASTLPAPNPIEKPSGNFFVDLWNGLKIIFRRNPPTGSV